MAAEVWGNPAHQPPQVFVSYAHDDEQHKDQVLWLARFLASRGIKVELDSWHTGRRLDWLAWATDQIARADYVIVIASARYRLVGDGNAAGDQNRGVQYETSVLRDFLYRDRDAWLPRLLPTVLPGHTLDELPVFLQPYGASHFVVDSISDAGLEELLRVLTGQPRDIAPELGTMPTLPPRTLGDGESEQHELWTQLERPRPIRWRHELISSHQEPPCSTVELHMVPTPATDHIPAWHMAGLAAELAELGAGRLLFSARDVRVDSSDQVACAHAMNRQTGWSGLALHKDGQRSGWIPLPHNMSGSILDHDDLINHLVLLITMLTEFSVSAPSAVAPALGLQPIGRLREGHVSELAGPSRPFSSSWPAQVRVEAHRTVGYAAALASPHEIVGELVAGLLAALHS